MNYELAKKLKDAGFPIPIHGQVMESEKETYYPTLEELIEECGNHFISLEKFGHKFKANAYIENDRIGDQLHVNGETPSEAVANLYLALHAPK